MPYCVPTAVVVTTALAVGGAYFGPGGIAAPDAEPFDEPVDKLPQSVAAGGQYLVTLAAIAAGQQGMVTALGVTVSDATVAEITTRVDGVAVPPLSAVLGAVGPMETPTPLASPIPLGPGQVFSLLIENTGAVNIDIAARVLGWTSS